MSSLQEAHIAAAGVKEPVNIGVESARAQAGQKAAAAQAGREVAAAQDGREVA